MHFFTTSKMYSYSVAIGRLRIAEQAVLKVGGIIAAVSHRVVASANGNGQPKAILIMIGGA